ncbi:hypothetical protein B0H14DRAFT_2691660 [Mycena olivaceomarginata]|nr:hypothetical protein B0H14DRAFT_2691660 [Mycena olivaceomarginata]
MGTTAFVYTTQICGSVPLFRLYNVAGTDHFYTSEDGFFFFVLPSLMLVPQPPIQNGPAFLASGLIDQGIAAYVPLGGIIPGVPFC